MLFILTLVKKQEPRPRIVGGKPAQRNSFPFAQVSIQNMNGHYCGGSVVAPDMILSAAHCAPDAGDVVVVGVFNLTETATTSSASSLVETFRIDEALIHPQYTDATNEFDVMLIKLLVDNRITVANPVRINSNERVPFWLDELKTVGWGATSVTYITDDEYEETYPTILHEVDLTYVAATRCQQIFTEFETQATPDMLCAGDQGQSVCFGDSGGPLFKVATDPSETILVGVTSWLLDCTGDYPAIFHRTSYSFDWIRDTICQASNSPPNYLDCSAGPRTSSPTETSSPPSMAPAPTIGVVPAATERPTVQAPSDMPVLPSTPSSRAQTSTVVSLLSQAAFLVLSVLVPVVLFSWEHQ